MSQEETCGEKSGTAYKDVPCHRLYEPDPGHRTCRLVDEAKRWHNLERHVSVLHIQLSQHSVAKSDKTVLWIRGDS